MRSEICRIPGSTVLPSPAGTPTLIRLPHIRHEDFRQFITYVYTAKIILHDSKVFQIMNIAHDLGLTDLKTACEDHVIATMSVGNACTFLTSAMEIQEKSVENALIHSSIAASFTLASMQTSA